MNLRLLLVFGLASVAMGQVAPGAHPVRGTGELRASQTAEAKSTIRFEDATAKAGIDFTHSFGSAKLGSLLEGTGSGCVWFDYKTMDCRTCMC